MWLKLEKDGMKLELRIRDYQASKVRERDYKWCNVDVSFEFPGCLRYSKRNDETLINEEVEDLECKLDALIQGTMREKEVMSCIEPDFSLKKSIKALN